MRSSLPMLARDEPFAPSACSPAPPHCCATVSWPCLYFMGHASQGFWRILNSGQLAIVYSWLALYLAAQGPGAWAVDRSRLFERGALACHPRIDLLSRWCDRATRQTFSS